MTITPTMTLQDWRDRAQSFEFRGHTIAYWTDGPAGNAKPLLLVHGYPTASWDWTPIWERLSRTRHLIAADMLGFSLSDKPDGGYSLHAQADLQEALLAHLGVGDYDALVHDYGATVGQELLARRNEGSGAQGLTSVYFLNGGIVPGFHRPRLIQRIGAGRMGWIVGRLMNRRRFGTSFSAVFGPDTQPTEAELDDFWELIAHKGGHRRIHLLLHYMAERDTHRERWVGAMRNATVPIGILNGALDPVSGRHLFEAAMREAPQLDATVLHDVGHYPQVEASERTADAYLAFLERHELWASPGIASA